MNILVLGGTRFFGVHLVKELIKLGHQVTIATRGNIKDMFGEQVIRLHLDRSNELELKQVFQGKAYDIICDNIAYSSNDVKYILDHVSCKRYILTSTMSVYSELTLDIKETAFEPLKHKLLWCNHNDFLYNEVKRQAECALYQKYPHICSAAVRLPFVIGEDDYTNRLYFYVEHIVKGIPMFVDNMNEPMSFIHAVDAGKFLAWLAICQDTGIFNANNEGVYSLQQLFDYISSKTKKKPIITADGDKAPYNGVKAYSLNTERASNIGYTFPRTSTYMNELLDFYIQQAQGSESK